MNRVSVFLAAFLHIGIANAFADHNEDALVARALSGDALAASLIRARGPVGVEELLKEPTAQFKDIQHAKILDGICAQKDCAYSHLYWFTNLDAAKREAKRLHRPILSLKLLGRLDKDLSCANSRLFRTVLYPDPEVNSRLSKDFILHWSSERDVPVVTVDFGNGRKLTTTVTGNSVHYILDENGRLIDALPGMYAPLHFAEILDRGRHEARRVAKLRGLEYRQSLKAFHQASLSELDRQISASPLKKAGLENGFITPLFFRNLWRSLRDGLIEDGTATKAAMETPMVKHVSLGWNETKAAYEQQRVLKIHSPDTPIDLERVFLRFSASYLPVLSESAMELVSRKSGSTSAKDTMRANLERSILRDSIRNELLLHRAVHQVLSSDSMSMTEMNRYIYDELFVAKVSDPYLGLLNDSVFLGLDGQGLE